MKKLISTFAIFALIFTTSCEKENMEDPFLNETINTNARAFFHTKALDNVGDAPSTLKFTVQGHDDARVIAIHPNGNEIKAVQLVQGTEDTKDFNIYGEVNYHVDSEGFVIVTQLTENNPEGVTLRFNASQVSFQ